MLKIGRVPTSSLLYSVNCEEAVVLLVLIQRKGGGRLSVLSLPQVTTTSEGVVGCCCWITLLLWLVVTVGAVVCRLSSRLRSLLRTKRMAIRWLPLPPAIIFKLFLSAPQLKRFLMETFFSASAFFASLAGLSG